MARNKLMTGEWLSADGDKWIGRAVLCRFSDGGEGVLKWNGYYWTGQNGERESETVGHRVVAFYIYERYRESEVI